MGVGERMEAYEIGPCGVGRRKRSVGSRPKSDDTIQREAKKVDLIEGSIEEASQKGKRDKEGNYKSKKRKGGASIR